MQADRRTTHKPDDALSGRYLVTVEMEPLEDGRYLAIATNLPGAHAEGDTISEALENLEDVSRLTIELCREKDLPLPAEFKGIAKTPLIKAEVLVQVEA